MEMNSKKKYIIEGIMVFAAICRIGLANWLGIWFPCSQVYDDALLIRYADISRHFSEPNIDSLLKYLGYPVYLKMVSKTPFSYATITALLWILSAVCVYCIARRLTKRNIFSLAAYLYTMYIPVAFDLYCGTRLYRNAVIAPFSCISLSCMGLLILYMKDEQRGIVKSICLGILTGISFTWCYYMKEDGIWLKVCLLFAFIYAIVSFLIQLVRKRQRMFKSFLSAILLIAIPVLIYKVTTLQYIHANYEAFGVSDLSTRTEGQLGEFVNSIYKIDSENRTSAIWAPYDAIEKAFAASPTLSNHPELLQTIHDSPWVSGNIDENPIRGDFLTWVLRTALNDTGLWQNEAQMSDFFGKVNKEIQNAFANGSLKKDTKRIQILGSAGGRTISEVFDLLPIIRESFKGVILQKGVIIGSAMVSQEEIASQQELCEEAVQLTNTEYLTDYSFRFNSITNASAICELIVIIYKVVNVILFLGGIGIIIWQIFSFLVNRTKWKLYLRKNGSAVEKAFMALVMFGVAIVYSFGIAWFSSFLGEEGFRFLNYYNVALPGMMTLAYVLVWSSLFKSKEKREK